jgi:hypothetical protein
MGVPGPNIHDMTPVGRDQALKHHTLSHMEEDITRRLEKIAIRAKKIERRVIHKHHDSFSGF